MSDNIRKGSFDKTNGNPSSGRSPVIRDSLASPDIEERRNAIFRIVNQKLVEYAPDVLELMIREVHGELKSRCAWALGKLNYKDAYPFLVKGLRHPSSEMRIWSAWALGEMGIEKSISHLTQARKRENLNEVQRAIGGALKKLAGESTRVHRNQIAKLLKPPSTHNSQITQLVSQLEKLHWPENSDDIIKIRSRIKQIDPQYFQVYMEWLKRKPMIMKTLDDETKTF